MLAVVGLDLSVRACPGGEPLRDSAHGSLLEGLRVLIAPGLGWLREVGLPIAGDRRAWDAMITGRDAEGPERWRVGVEAEMRPTDVQALERRIALKERDDHVDAVLLVLADTRHNRQLLRVHGEALRARFPVQAAAAIADLAAGRKPSGSAIVLIPTRRRAREAPKRPA